MKRGQSIPVFILFFALLFSVLSCEREEVVGDVPLDCQSPIETPSFANDIVPVLQRECYSCHSNENHDFLGEGINLGGHQNVFPYIKNGKLLGSIKHEDFCLPMPLNGNKIPDCDIENIERWILQGAMNN